MYIMFASFDNAIETSWTRGAVKTTNANSPPSAYELKTGERGSLFCSFSELLQVRYGMGTRVRTCPFRAAINERYGGAVSASATSSDARVHHIAVDESRHGTSMDDDERRCIARSSNLLVPQKMAPC